jgi:hypothetical protein
MDVHNEQGAISAAEGCMFAAMALFAILLVALLVIAALRFSSPPEGTPMSMRPDATAEVGFA